MSTAGLLDPNTFTVDRLRKELADHNVPLPKYSKKDVLVGLYKQHIVNVRAPRTAASHGFEFSDEDDAVGEVANSRKSLGTMSKRRSVGTKGRDELIITSSGFNISGLTDVELVESLHRKGADVGPVTDTTRGVYEKKLLRLLEGGVQRDKAPAAPRISPLKNRAEEQQRKPIAHYSDEEETEEVEEEEEEDMEEEESYGDNLRESYGQHSNRYNNEDYSENLTGRKQYTKVEESYDPFHYRRSMESAIRQPLSSYGQTGDLSRPQLSGFTSTTRRSQVYTTSSEYSTPRPGHISRDGLSSSLASTGRQQTGTVKAKRSRFWLIVLLFLIALIVILAVAWNMAPAFQNPVLPLSSV